MSISKKLACNLIVLPEVPKSGLGGGLKAYPWMGGGGGAGGASTARAKRTALHGTRRLSQGTLACGPPPGAPLLSSPRLALAVTRRPPLAQSLLLLPGLTCFHRKPESHTPTPLRVCVIRDPPHRPPNARLKGPSVPRWHVALHHALLFLTAPSSVLSLLRQPLHLGGSDR